MHKKVLFGIIALMMLTMIMAACSIKDASTLPQGVQAKMGSTKFLETEVTVPKGQKLTLVNVNNIQHIIANGTWDGSTPKPGAEAGAPTVNVNSTSGSTSVGPFNTAGTF